MAPGPATTGEFCDKCFQTVLHQGQPSGTLGKVDGHDLYYALPDEGTYDKSVALLYCSDVWGIELVNNKLIVDSYAKAGFATYMPDYLNGDCITPEKTKAPGFSIPAWGAGHSSETVRPALDATIKKLQNEGVRTFFAVGYCFGARYVVDLGLEGLLKAGAVAHPSRLQVPDDLEKLKALERKVPMLFLTCERDAQFPLTSSEKADEILGSLTAQGLYRRVHYDDNDHGFAVRGDLSKPVVKAAKEDAFKQAVEWFQKHA